MRPPSGEGEVFMSEALLDKWLGEMGIEADAHGESRLFATGHIAIVLTPDESDENGNFINIECPVLINPRAGVNLYRDLLLRNSMVRIGAFSLESDTVMFSYSMPAVEGADAEFAAVLKMVAKIANDASGELQKIHGGRRVGDERKDNGKQST